MVDTLIKYIHQFRGGERFVHELIEGLLISFQLLYRWRGARVCLCLVYVCVCSSWLDYGHKSARSETSRYEKGQCKEGSYLVGDNFGSISDIPGGYCDDRNRWNIPRCFRCTNKARGGVAVHFGHTNI